MTVVTVISVLVSVLSLLVGGGVIFKLIDIGRQNGRVEQRISTLEERAKEDRQKDAAKFDTLYNDRNDSRDRLTRLETKLDSVSVSIVTLTAAVDKLSVKLEERK